MTNLLRLGLLTLVITIGVGCDKDETAIRTYSAPKDAPAPPEEAASNNTPPPNSSAPLTWTVPAGWTQDPGSSQMRFATFHVSSEDPKALLTVVPLPQEAAEVLPNVKRWAGQLKLPDAAESDLGKYAYQTQVSGEQATVVDMTGSAESGIPPTRLLAAIIPHGSQAWFFTLKAPEPIASAQKSNFETFIHSIQFASSESGTTPQADTTSTQPAVTSFKLAKWTTPEGWHEQPGSNSMRVTSFRIESGDQQAEVIVSRVRQGQTGSFLDNINRWRGQVGLEPVADQKPGDMKPIGVAGHEALFLTFTGPAVDGTSPKQVLVAMDIEGPDFWFFKLLGPQSLVSQQQETFKQFLNSLQFEPESH